MKCRILSASVLVSFLLCAACNHSASGTNSASSTNSVSDFRKAQWGMSPTEVKTTEQVELIMPDNRNPLSIGILKKDEKISGLDVKVAYTFAYNKLIRGSYLVTTDHTNPTDYISDYDSVVKALTERYGTPFHNKEVWKSDLFKNDPSKWGLAVATSHLIKTAHWATDRSGIDILLSGDNYKISLAIVYESLNKEHMALVKEAEMADDKGKL